MNEILETLKENLEADGVIIMIHSAVCENHKITRHNCIGCISENGCEKYVREALAVIDHLSGE